MQHHHLSKEIFGSVLVEPKEGRKHEVDDDVIDVSRIDHLCPMLHVEFTQHCMIVYMEDKGPTTLSHNININTTSSTLHSPTTLFCVLSVVFQDPRNKFKTRR